MTFRFFSLCLDMLKNNFDYIHLSIPFYNFLKNGRMLWLFRGTQRMNIKLHCFLPGRMPLTIDSAENTQHRIVHIL